MTIRNIIVYSVVLCIGLTSLVYLNHAIRTIIEANAAQEFAEQFVFETLGVNPKSERLNSCSVALKNDIRTFVELNGPVRTIIRSGVPPQAPGKEFESGIVTVHIHARTQRGRTDVYVDLRRTEEGFSVLGIDSEL